MDISVQIRGDYKCSSQKCIIWDRTSGMRHAQKTNLFFFWKMNLQWETPQCIPGHLTCHRNVVSCGEKGSYQLRPDSDIIIMALSKRFLKAIRGISGKQNVIIHLEFSQAHTTQNSAFIASNTALHLHYLPWQDCKADCTD